LKNRDSEVRGTKDLLVLAPDFYRSLFGPGEGNAFVIDFNLWQDTENVSESENVELTRPFLEEEIKTCPI
jgi:hypothetical protein